MISINKIRENSGLVLIIVGLAMLAFILGDLFSNKPGQNAINIGVVAGENIEVADFEKKVAEEEEALQSTNQRIDENTREQLRNQVWNQFVRDLVIGKEINDVGIDVAGAEYDDIRFGNNIMPDFKNDQSFQDPATGQFDPQRVKMFFNEIQTNYPLFWKSQRDRIVEARKMAKYNNLVKKGVYVNKIEAEAEYVNNTRRVDLNYVVGKYASIADSTVKPTEDELKAFFKENKDLVKYKQTENRSIEFVSFDIKATPEDIKAAEEAINALVEPFKTAASDSLFVVNNSDQKVYNPEIYQKGSTAPETDSLLTRASVGTVVGPYTQGDQLRLAKVVGNGFVTEVFPRHILLKPTGTVTNEMLKVQADSIMKAIKKNGNFAEVAQAISEDKGSGQQGGDLEWVGEGSRMVKEFEAACLKLNKGEMGIAETEFGIHIIEAKDRRQTEQIKLAIVQRSLAPSKRTVNDAYEKASGFSINNNTTELFNKTVETDKLAKQSAPNLAPQSKFIPGVSDPTQLMRWVNNAEVGQVSEPFEIGNQFVVATLVRITEDGAPEFEDIKDQLERELIKKKKGEIILAKIKGKNLATIANELGETVQTATELTFNSAVIPQGGREPKVIGVASTLPKNALSKPILGENGVYVLEVSQITEAPATKDFTASKQQVTSKYVSRADYGALNALIEKANVKDLRYKFY